MVRSPGHLTRSLRKPLCCRLTRKESLWLRTFRRKNGNVPQRNMHSVEQSALDAEAGGLQSGNDIVDRPRVARFAFDLDHRVFGGQLREDAAVVDLDDVD